MRKWLNWFLLVTAFSVVCVLLADWQLDRRDLRLASIDLVRENYQSSPRTLEASLQNGKFRLPDDTWRQVRVTGTYLPSSLLMVRNRPNDGQPGFEQLVPFRADSGTIVFVSRGWLPTGSKQDLPDINPQPMAFTTTLVGRIVASEPELARSAPPGQIASINPDIASDLLGLTNTVTNGYVRLSSESPKTSEPLRSMPVPSITEGNNLSYAAQWIIFALMAIWALLWRIRRDAQLANGTYKSKRRTTRSQLDQDFEDEITRVK